MKDEQIDAGDEDLRQRAEGSSEHRASLLHTVCEQQVPHTRCHYTLKRHTHFASVPACRILFNLLQHSTYTWSLQEFNLTQYTTVTISVVPLRAQTAMLVLCIDRASAPA